MSATNLQNFSGDVQIRGTTFIKANTNTDNLAIGTDAGETAQGNNTVAVGKGAGATSQGAQGVAVGYLTGNSEQGTVAVAVGNQAGKTSQGDYAIAVGSAAGLTEQGNNAVAVGRLAGTSAQGALTTAFGYAAGRTSQGTHCVGVGQEAGKSNQGAFSTALGSSAGSTSQGAAAVAVGRLAGLSNQGDYATAVGKESGKISQGDYTVAVGGTAGLSNQGAYATALGNAAGLTSQGVFATALGSTAGMTNQEPLAVAIGRDSGTTSQGCHATAVGYASGNSKQGIHATAVGHAAGQNVQGAFGVALGASAAATSQGANAVAVGPVAGNNNQGTQAVAVGYAAGQVSQGTQSVAVGYASGTTNQGGLAVAVGFQTGQVSQAAYGIAVGFYAGQSAQATNAVAVGRGAGGKDQGTHSTAVGYHAARSNQGTFCTALGNQAGELAQGNIATAVGNLAGQTSQAGNGTAMGNQAGKLSQGTGAVALGVLAGGSNQGTYGNAIGYQAGETGQGTETVAVGNSAGMSGQGAFSTALGSLAGRLSQGIVSTAIGRAAGMVSQGAFAVAIGYRAGYSAQGAHSIILNGTNAAFNSTTASSFHVKPVRGGNMTASALSYTADGEIVEQTNIHFDGSGNLGIGTAAPSDSIHLYKAATDQTTGLLIEKANGGSGSANAFFCVASNSGEANRVSVPKAGIMFERTAQYGLGKLKLCVDSSNDTNPVGVSDSLICLLNNTHLGFGPNLTPSQRFHFQWSTEADHMYMQFGGVTHNATSAWWKPYFYTPGNTSNGTYAGATYYSNNMFFGCGRFDVGWGSDYYGGSITIRAGDVRSPGNNGTASSTNYNGGHVYLDGGVTTTGSSTGGTSRTYGGSIIFRCQSTDTTANTDQNLYERMRVDGTTGRVGIGTTAPTQLLTVQGSMGLGSAASAAGGTFRPAVYWYQTYSGTSGYSRFYMDVNNTFVVEVNGYNKMYLRPDGDLLLNNFTGQHRCIVDDVYSNTAVDHEGLIVCANKNSFTGASFGIKKGCEAITMNESLPDVSLSNVAYDKSCYGVLSASEDPDTREDTYGTITIPIDKEVGDIRMFINSVGEGAIWVINTNGNLESGDYITTSNVVGYGMRQDDDILHNYTVAKIAMDCDFEPVTQAVKQIVKVMGTVNSWVNTTYTDITYEEYSNLTDDMRMTVTQTSYSKEDSTISTDEYNALTSDIQSTYTEMTQIKYSQINKETSKNEIIGENYELEVRQEMVNVLDEHGQLQWEDDPSGATEKAYKIRYLDANGVITDEANAVHTAAFVGCTYHCG